MFARLINQRARKKAGAFNVLCCGGAMWVPSAASLLSLPILDKHFRAVQVWPDILLFVHPGKQQQRHGADEGDPP